MLKWYHPGRKNYFYHDTDDSVAEAVKSTHPDEALAIWKRMAEWEIARVKPAAYKVAAPYLKKYVHSTENKNALMNGIPISRP